MDFEGWGSGQLTVGGGRDILRGGVFPRGGSRGLSGETRANSPSRSAMLSYGS